LGIFQKNAIADAKIEPDDIQFWIGPKSPDSMAALAQEPKP
jgi:hypothetical protein